MKTEDAINMEAISYSRKYKDNSEQQLISCFSFKDGAEFANPKWIDVNDMLPDKNMDVLLGFKKTGVIRLGEYESNNFYAGTMICMPTHWMPVLQLP